MEQQQSPLLSRVVKSLQYRSSFAGGKLRSTLSERNELESGSTKNKIFNLSKNGILVGRDEESKKLQECMNRIIEQHTTELAVIHGTSGCGKSSLVQSFARNLPPEVLYVEGKFDQLQSHAPYSVLVTASDQLCRHILNKKIVAKFVIEFDPS
jgi:ABC-type transport system involved in cytochrome bd biosynthesis fused ATPase/permease subunit